MTYTHLLTILLFFLELKTIPSIVLFSLTTENDETHEFTSYFITSLTNLDEFTDSVRKHWSIENQLQWCFDVIFREDASRARKDNSPLVLNILRKIALSLV